MRVETAPPRRKSICSRVIQCMCIECCSTLVSRPSRRPCNKLGPAVAAAVREIGLSSTEHTALARDRHTSGICVCENWESGRIGFIGHTTGKALAKKYLAHYVI